MSQTLCDMKKTIRAMGDVSSLAKQHPWFATGLAVAVGFVTGAALTPSRGKKLRKRGPNSEAELLANFQGQETVKTRKSFLFSTFGIVLAGILRTVVQGLLAEAVVTKERIETPSPRDTPGDAAPKNGSV